MLRGKLWAVLAVSAIDAVVVVPVLLLLAQFLSPTESPLTALSLSLYRWDVLCTLAIAGGTSAFMLCSALILCSHWCASFLFVLSITLGMYCAVVSIGICERLWWLANFSRSTFMIYCCQQPDFVPTTYQGLLLLELNPSYWKEVALPFLPLALVTGVVMGMLTESLLGRFHLRRAQQSS